MALLFLLPDVPALTWAVLAGALYALGWGGIKVYKGARTAIDNARLAKTTRQAEVDKQIEAHTSGIREQAGRWESTCHALELQLKVEQQAREEWKEEKQKLEEKCKEVSEYNFTLQGDLDRMRRRQGLIEEANETLRARNVELEQKLLEHIRDDIHQSRS